MKKSRVILIVVTVVLIVLCTTSQVKNSIGNFFHWGTCPNCGNSWWWKESGGIQYAGPDCNTESGSLPIIEISREVMICKKCLANLAGLDEMKIEQDLLNSEWSPEKAALVREAVIRYKEEKLQIQQKTK